MMFSLECTNVVLESVRRTFKRVFLVLMFTVLFECPSSVVSHSECSGCAGVGHRSVFECYCGSCVKFSEPGSD